MQLAIKLNQKRYQREKPRSFNDFRAFLRPIFEVGKKDIKKGFGKINGLEPLPNAEAHNTYLDIQYLIEGHELIGVAQRETLTEVEAHPERDIWFYTGKYEYLSLGDNRFIILWPHDAHAPNHAVDGIPVATRKCVVKVRV